VEGGKVFGKWRNYKCCKCERRASGPKIETSSSLFSSTPEGDNISTSQYVDKDLPNDLYQCSDCGRWFCSKCKGGEWGPCPECRAQSEARRQAAIPDWQKKIAADEAQHSANEKAAREKAEREQAERKIADEKAKMAAYQAKFYCYLCKKPSQGPPTTTDGTYVRLWHKEPTDITRCRTCGRWICSSSNCSYIGICRECGKRMR
jgi:hypothetical protein